MHIVEAIAVDQKADTLALRVHDLAAKARMDRDTKKWAPAYGEFLRTCAACHQALGVVPKP
jgi:mono/diheme cytochrome c family protein